MPRQCEDESNLRTHQPRTDHPDLFHRYPLTDQRPRLVKAWPRAKPTNQSMALGFAIDDRFAAVSGERPKRILRTGTSSFFPDSVRGTCGIANTSSGTWRADKRVRID